MFVFFNLDICGVEFSIHRPILRKNPRVLFFEIAAMPFPYNGPLFCCVNLPLCFSIHLLVVLSLMMCTRLDQGLIDFALMTIACFAKPQRNWNAEKNEDLTKKGTNRRTPKCRIFVAWKWKGFLSFYLYFTLDDIPRRLWPSSRLGFQNKAISV